MPTPIPLLFTALLAAGPAEAQDRGARADDAAYVADEAAAYVPAPRDRLWYANATFARYNPLGLIESHKVGWRHRLSDRDGVMLQDTYSFLGLNALVTPAWSRLGLAGEAQLLAVFRVFGDLSAVGYYGSFDQILLWQDPAAAYSDDTIAALGDGARPSLGWTGTAGATLRAKVGPVALRSTAQVSRIDLSLGDEEGAFFYDQYWDRLARDGGWAILDDTDLLYVDGKLRLGLRHTWSDDLDAPDVRPEDTPGALAHHRLGPLFAWQFRDDPPGARFNQPTLFVLTQWWLQHPYRTGQEQAQALPLIAAGFAFNGDHAVLSR